MRYFDEMEKEELPFRAKNLYKYLVERSDKDGKCWPALKTISRDTYMSKRTVQRAIQDLLQCELVTKEKRYRVNGSHTSNIYVLKK